MTIFSTQVIALPVYVWSLRCDASRLRCRGHQSLMLSQLSSADARNPYLKTNYRKWTFARIENGHCPLSKMDIAWIENGTFRTVEVFKVPLKRKSR